MFGFARLRFVIVPLMVATVVSLLVGVYAWNATKPSSVSASKQHWRAVGCAGSVSPGKGYKATVDPCQLREPGEAVRTLTGTGDFSSQTCTATKSYERRYVLLVPEGKALGFQYNCDGNGYPALPPR